jgi:hypothetical protein
MDEQPVQLCPSGEHDPVWKELKSKNGLWKDKKLKEAAMEFCALVQAQHQENTH